MAIKLASLFIELAVNGDKLTAELKKSTSKTKAWAKATEKAADSVKKAFTAIGVGTGVATAGLTAMYLSNSQTLDALGKTASKLGSTTEGLKVFGVAASYGGVSIESANTALQRMTRRMSEAALGTGSAAKAVKELGLDAERLAAMDPAKAYVEVAAALEGVENAADRVRLAMAFFDTRGVSLVNVLGATLQQAKADVEAFGGALTSIEVAQIEAANDSVTRLGIGFDLLSDKLTYRMSFAVKAVADQLFSSATQGQQLEKTLDDLITSSINGFGSLAVTTGGILKFIDGRPELATGGIIGYLLGGKLGFLAGAAVAATLETVSATFDYYKGKFDLTLSDAEKAELALKKIVAEMDLLKSPIGLLRLDREETLAELEEQRRAVATILSDMGEFDRITTSVFEQSNGAASMLGQTLIDLGDSIKTSSQNVAELLTTPAPVPGLPTGGKSANDEEPGVHDNLDPYDARLGSFINFNTLKLQASNDYRQAESDERDAYFARELWQQQHFQNTWSLFQRSGSKDRLGILRKETSGAMDTLSQHSRTMFEINKAVGLANATVFIATGISNALSLPFPANLAAAATVALQGAAQIQAITKAKYGAAEVVTPTNSSSASPTPVSNVGSVNSDTAANSTNINDTDDGENGTSINIFGFHTAGATDEQKAEEVAQWMQIAQDNDLLVPNKNGGLNYTGTGASAYTQPIYGAVG